MADEVGHEHMISYLQKLYNKDKKNQIFKEFLKRNHQDLGILPN